MLDTTAFMHAGVFNLTTALFPPSLSLWFPLLVVFMDEAGLPEESHESLKVRFTVLECR